MFKILKKIISFKLILTKPNKKKILIYDKEGSHFYNIFFPKKQYEILHVRYESINIYVTLLTLIKFGFKNFINNYKKCFISLVSPKIVFTAIDNNPAFYKLKNINDKPYYVSFQNGMREGTFYKECQNYIRKTKQKLKCDYIFVFGNNEKKRLSKIIDAKIYSVGNAVNNYYQTKKRRNQNKIISMMYISIFNYRKGSLEEDKKIFNFLIDFCKKRKIKLTYGAKLGPDKEALFRDELNKGDWTYFPSGNPKKTYNYVNKQQLVVFTSSTLGYESLAKGLKCAVFNKKFPIRGNYTKYPESGFFWNKGKNEHEMEKVLNRVLNTSNKKWKEIASKYSFEIMSYDPKNKKVKKILKNILKERIVVN